MYMSVYEEMFVCIVCGECISLYVCDREREREIVRVCVYVMR